MYRTVVIRVELFDTRQVRSRHYGDTSNPTALLNCSKHQEMRKLCTAKFTFTVVHNVMKIVHVQSKFTKMAEEVLS